MLFKDRLIETKRRLFCQDSGLKVVICILVFIPKQIERVWLVRFERGSKYFPSPFRVEIDRLWEMSKCRVWGGEQRLMISI